MSVSLKVFALELCLTYVVESVHKSSDDAVLRPCNL